MKKLTALLIVAILVMSMSLTAFAAPAGFVSSPSGKPAPTIISSTTDDGCSGTIIITSYSEREKLTEEERKQIEDAYNQITSNAGNLGNLSKELQDLLNKLNIDSNKAGITDLFKLGTSGCTEHNGNHLFDVTLKPETLKDFVALLRFDGQKWVVVTDAKVKGDHLTFSSPALNTYAIVTGSASESTSPKTGDVSGLAVYAFAMLASASLAVVFWKKSANSVA